MLTAMASGKQFMACKRGKCVARGTYQWTLPMGLLWGKSLLSPVTLISSSASLCEQINLLSIVAWCGDYDCRKKLVESGHSHSAAKTFLQRRRKFWARVNQPQCYFNTLSNILSNVCRPGSARFQTSSEEQNSQVDISAVCFDIPSRESIRWCIINRSPQRFSWAAQKTGKNFLVELIAS